MANVCDNDLFISGPEKELRYIYLSIKNQDDDLINEFPFLKKGIYYGIMNHDAVDGELHNPIHLNIASKWNPPLEGVEELSRQYPTLEFKMTFIEEGVNLYGWALFKDGTGQVVDQTAYEFHVENNEDIAETLQWIRDTSPDEIVEELANDDLEEENSFFSYPFSVLQKDLIEKMPRDLLPLLLTYPWETEAMALLKEKLTKEE